jgi:glycosyltransferase involved in cell wall biosynthesis
VPSIAEGFGLPGLEAMSVGTPVVSSNSSCLPEVYGNAALFFDPLDVDDMAAKLALMWRSPDLREELARAGRMRAGEFSWANTAAATLDAYRRALVDA